MAVNWLIQVALLVASYFLAPKPQDAKPAGMKDFDLPTAEIGEPIPVLFGRRKIASPNVVWFGDYRAKKIKSKSKK